METRTRKDGRVIHRESVFVNGHKINSPFFPRKADAKEWKRQKLTTRDKVSIHGEEIIINQNKKFLEFSQEWVEKTVKTHRALRTYQSYKSVLEKHFIPTLGNLLLKNVKKDHIDHIVSELKSKGHAGKGINNIIGVVKVLMNDAKKKNYLLISPLMNYEKCMEESKGEVFFSKQEIMQFLMANSQDELFSLYIVALNTGLRRGELCGLCWDRIDFQNQIIEVTRTKDRNGMSDTTKTRLKRIVPMNDEVYRVLLELRRKQLHHQFVFCHSDGRPVDPNHLHRFFKKAQKKAGISKEIRFHDLRHTYASHFMMNRGSVFDLQKILGHTKIEMTMRYAHFSPDHLREAVKTVSFSLPRQDIHKDVIQLVGQSKA